VCANLDLVRSIYAAWERGDFSKDTWAAPRIEFERADGPAPGIWRGKDRIAAGIREMLSAWEDFRLSADEYREVDDKRVLVLAHMTGRGKRSQMDSAHLGATGANLFHVEHGKVTRVVTYYSRDRALADLGLEGLAVTEESTMPDPEEAVRRALEALNRRDFDAAFSLYAPDVVFELAPGGIGVLQGGRVMGREAARKTWEDLTESFADFEFESQDFHDLGRGVTFDVLVQRGRPHGSDAFVETRAGVVAIWRDERIARVTTYEDVAEARAAAERLAEERG
jgi:ketosteroid isomerase-like protein